MGNIFTRAGLVGSTAEDLARKRELGERLQSRALASLETSRANRKEAERIARLIDERIRSQKQGAALQQAQEVARKTQNVGSIEDGALTNYDAARKTQKAPRQTPAGIRPRTVTRAQRDALSYDQAAPARTTPTGPLVRGGSPLPPYAATSMMGSQLGAVPDDLNRLNDQIRLASARADGMFRVPASSLGPRRMESTGSIEDAALAGMLARPVAGAMTPPNNRGVGFPALPLGPPSVEGGYPDMAPARTTPIGPLVRGGSPLPPYAATSMMGSQLGAVPDDLNRLNDQIRLASARADGMFRVPASSLGPRRMESTGSIEDAALAGMEARGMLGATPGAQPASAGLGESFLNVLVPAAQGSTSPLEALESSGWPDIVRLTPTVLDISEQQISNGNNVFGQDATKYKQPYKFIIVHDTYTDNLKGEINYINKKKGDKNTGYHAVVGGGKVYIVAPPGVRVNGTKLPTVSGQKNANSFHIAFVDKSQKSVQAAADFVKQFASKFNIPLTNISNHGSAENRPNVEGVEATKKLLEALGPNPEASVGVGRAKQRADVVSWLNSFRPTNNFTPTPTPTSPIPEVLDVLVQHGQDNLSSGKSVENRDGSVSTVRSMSVNDERLNNGAITLIPSIWDGKELGLEESIDRAIKSEKKYPTFASHEEAKQASLAVSRQIEMGGTSSSREAQAQAQAQYDPGRGLQQTPGALGRAMGIGQSREEIKKPVTSDEILYPSRTKEAPALGAAATTTGTIEDSALADTVGRTPIAVDRDTAARIDNTSAEQFAALGTQVNLQDPLSVRRARLEDQILASFIRMGINSININNPQPPEWLQGVMLKRAGLQQGMVMSGFKNALAVKDPMTAAKFLQDITGRDIRPTVTDAGYILVEGDRVISPTPMKKIGELLQQMYSLGDSQFAASISARAQEQSMLLFKHTLAMRASASSEAAAEKLEILKARIRQNTGEVKSIIDNMGYVYFYDKSTGKQLGYIKPADRADGTPVYYSQFPTGTDADFGEQTDTPLE